MQRPRVDKLSQDSRLLRQEIFASSPLPSGLWHSYILPNFVREQVARRLAAVYGDRFVVTGQFAIHAMGVRKSRLPKDLDIELAGNHTPEEALHTFMHALRIRSGALFEIHGATPRRVGRNTVVVKIGARIGNEEINMQVDLSFNRHPRIGDTQRLKGLLRSNQWSSKGVLSGPYATLSKEQTVAKKLYGAALLHDRRPCDATDLYVLLQDDAFARAIDSALVGEALQTKFKWDAEILAAQGRGYDQLPTALSVADQGTESALRAAGLDVTAEDVESYLNDVFERVLSGDTAQRFFHKGLWVSSDLTTARERAEPGRPQIRGVAI